MFYNNRKALEVFALKKILKLFGIILGLALAAVVLLLAALVLFPSFSLFGLKYQTRSRTYYNTFNTTIVNYKKMGEDVKWSTDELKLEVPNYDSITINTDYYNVDILASDVDNQQTDIITKMNKKYSGLIKKDSGTTESVYTVKRTINNYLSYSKEKSDASIVRVDNVKINTIVHRYVKEESSLYVVYLGEEVTEQPINDKYIIDINKNTKAEAEQYLEDNKLGDYDSEEEKPAAQLWLESFVNRIIEIYNEIYREDGELINENETAPRYVYIAEDDAIYPINEDGCYTTESYDLVIDLKNIEKFFLITKDTTNATIEIPVDYLKNGKTNLVVNGKSATVTVGGEKEKTEVVKTETKTISKDKWLIGGETIRKDNSLSEKTEQFYYHMYFNDINVKTETGNVYINKTIKFNDSEDNKITIETKTGNIFNYTIMNVSSTYKTESGNIAIEPYDENFKTINGNVNISSNDSIIKMPNVKGNVICDSKSGQINIDEINGSFTATEKTSHTEINIGYVDGEFLVPEAEYSNINLGDVNSKLEIYTKKGNININNLSTIIANDPYTSRLKTETGKISVGYVDNANLNIESDGGDIYVSYSTESNGAKIYNKNTNSSLIINTKKSKVDLNDVNVFLDLVSTEKTSKDIHVSFKEVINVTDDENNKIPSAIKVKNQDVFVKLPSQAVSIASDKVDLSKTTYEDVFITVEGKKVNKEYKTTIGEEEVSYGAIHAVNPPYNSNNSTLILYSSEGKSGSIVVEPLLEE